MTDSVTAEQIAEFQRLCNRSVSKALQTDKCSARFVREVLEHHYETLRDELTYLVEHKMTALNEGMSGYAEVDRHLNWMQALGATRCLATLHSSIAEEMPKGIGSMVAIHFFCPNKSLDDEALAMEYEERGLVPADPYSVAAVNADQYTFLIRYPHATHWKDRFGHWCRMQFDYSEGKRCVSLNRKTHSWESKRWFAGMPKEGAVLRKSSWKDRVVHWLKHH